MFGTPGSPLRALVVLGSLLALSATGGDMPSRPSVVALGRIQGTSWNPICACNVVRMYAYGIGETYVIGDRPSRLARASHAAVLGHATSRSGLTVIEANYSVGLEGISMGAISVLQWLKRYPFIGLMLLMLLGLFEWHVVSILSVVVVGALSATGTALVLDFLTVRQIFAWSDSSWLLILTAAAATGMSLAGSAGISVQAAARDLAVSLVTALLFGDLAGIIGAAGGAVIPLLSKRVTMLFLTAAVFAAAFHWPDSYLRGVALCVFALACADQWKAALRNRGNQQPTAGATSGDTVPFLSTGTGGARARIVG